MTHHHDDNYGNKLWIDEGCPGEIRLMVPAEVYIDNDDVPGVVLAMLEEAGVEGSGISDPLLSTAWHALNAHEKRRAEQSERDAEDAKVVAFHGAIGANLDRIQRHHRDLYRAARDFFKEEA